MPSSGLLRRRAERHVAGAEVVDEHAHALAAQLVQGGEAAAAGGQHLLGDFQIELRGLDAGFARRAGDVFGETFGRQILAADIHRDAQRRITALGERGEIAAGAAQHPAAELARRARRVRRWAGIRRWAPGRGSCAASAGRPRPRRSRASPAAGAAGSEARVRPSGWPALSSSCQSRRVSEARRSVSE